ncbi:hypothetical protein MNBD_ALPHA08-709 [hydrothermal vent metagenome]|uniref:Alpha/beta hydrolase fold-3 domain-containing protein n=1 Tax=hydrothermal vent metagenome TaxID=652676 RepID=A0A3B0RZ04_9ZZZZ
MGKLAMLGGLLMVRLPEKLLELLYGERETYRGQTIDAKALALGRLANTVRIPDKLPTVAESREQSQKTAVMFDRKGPRLARVEDFDVEGAAGKIAARLYSDTANKTVPQPALVYYHGGGFIQGNLDSHNEICTKLAKWSGGIVVAIDYRLAPEHPFPAGVDDARAAFVWLSKNANTLGIDPTRIGVGGDSAGACFAAVVAADLSGKKHKPNFQVLIYPVLDGHLNSASINELANAYVLPKERMTWYRDLYRADFDDFNDPRFSPLFTKDFSSLPKTCLITGGFDPLCDEAIAYVQKLIAANVPTSHRHFPGQIHAFASLTSVIPQGTQALEEIAAWLRQHW